MQENNFVNKITGRGEKPISKMPGFHPPDDEEHEYILKKIQKNLKKETVSSGSWMIVGIIIVIMYIRMYFKSTSDDKGYILMAAGVFGVNGPDMCISPVFCRQTDFKYRKRKKISGKKCKNPSHNAWIRNNIWKSRSKSTRRKRNRLQLRFRLERKDKKRIQKNPETEFLLIKLDEKKEMYSITLPKKDNQEEMKEDE